MDIPRIFTVSESEHRIHNPFTQEKYATLGRVLRMKRGTRILDLGSGSGEMLCTWARDYGITGTGIDMSPLFTAQATRRAEELGVSERVHFIHNDAAGYVGLRWRNLDCGWRSRDDGSAGKKPQARGNNAHWRTVLASGTRDGGDSPGVRRLVDCRLSHSARSGCVFRSTGL